MHRRLTRLATVALVAFTVTACGARRDAARVEVVDRAGDLVGIARLTALGPGVALDFQGFRLPPGGHALHIHAIGECDPPDFVSAGPLFAPGEPAGDLPDLTVRSDGSTHYRWFIHDVSLDPDEPGSLLYGRGTALVLHVEGTATTTTEPPTRLACGVLRRGY
jgi:superoxide dismutase, Cu-Zn family